MGDYDETKTKGTTFYMSPELILMRNGYKIESFEPEKSVIFTIGLILLRCSTLTDERRLKGLND